MAGTCENRGQEGTGGGRRKDRKQDCQSGRNWEIRRKTLQYCITFYNRNRTKRQEPLRSKGWEAGLKGTGGRSFRPPCLPPPAYLSRVTHRLYL